MVKKTQCDYILASMSNTTTVSSTTGPTPSSGPRPASSSPTSQLGAILGGILGGIALLVGALIFLLLRSRRKSNRERSARYQLNTTAIPYTGAPQATAAAPFAEKRQQRPQVTIRPVSSAPELSPSTTPSDAAIRLTNEQRNRSADHVVSPLASTSALSSPRAVDTPSIDGIYNMLATLITRIQPVVTPGEQPPEYDDAPRSPVQV